MIKRKFGWSGIQVPVIGQGTWKIDGDMEHLAIKALILGLDLGLTHIDTAEMYGNGRVEEMVGEAISGRRDQVFLVSKVLPSNASYEDTIKSCERSLKRLKTEWLDLYILHWPSSNYPISETMRAMERLVTEGLVRHIGVSNFDVRGLKEAEQTLQNERIACNQVLYNLGYRGIEQHVLPYCTKRGIAVVGYSPFGHGNFPSPQSAGGRMLLEIAQRHGKTSRQVVLNFLTRHHNIFSIPKTRVVERVRENSGSVGDWSLKEDEIEPIDKFFPLPDPNDPLEMI
jgi:diketogulonate reductase-like aldo/keto reductase